MPIIDIIIAVAIIVSIIVGLIRGFIKEAISMAALVIAVWAALYLGPSIGSVSESWLSSEEMQMWFGRLLVFAIVLAIGGLMGWGMAKLIRLSMLSSLDRFLGSLFGLVRGLVLIGIFILGGRFAGFSNDRWWIDSASIPYLENVADWIEVMAPQGLDLITPDKAAETAPVELSTELLSPRGT